MVHAACSSRAVKAPAGLWDGQSASRPAAPRAARHNVASAGCRLQVLSLCTHSAPAARMCGRMRAHALPRQGTSCPHQAAPSARVTAARPAIRPSRATASSAQASTGSSSSSSAGSNVVIVGGGPAGIATAVMLAKRGWRGITILERRKDVAVEERDKSYVYMIDGRGRRALAGLGPGVADALDDYGVSTESMSITRVFPDGKLKNMTMSVKDQERISHWLPRTSLMRLLVNEALTKGGWLQAEAGAGTDTQAGASSAAASAAPQTAAAGIETDAARNAAKGVVAVAERGEADAAQGAAPIRIITEAEVERIARVAGGGVKVVVKRTGSAAGSQPLELQPTLLVGTDGARSVVRATLESWESQAAAASSPTADGAIAKPASRNRFSLVEQFSPSAGLRFKVLQLPPSPVVSSALGTEPLPHTQAAVIQGKAGPSGIRLGMLPMKDPAMPRTANLITRPDHPVWDASTTEALYSFFERELPQLPMRALVDQREAAAFAESRGGRFPAPQACAGLQRVVGGADGHTSGVVLLGDARGCFPPDLGQGVNSALGDVEELGKALDTAGGDLADALPRYEAARAPQIASLIHLMTFSFPWQYNQSKAQYNLWTVNFALRALMNKLLPAWFHPHSFLLLQDSTLTYSDVVERAHATTARMKALGAGVAALLLALAVRAALGTT